MRLAVLVDIETRFAEDIHPGSCLLSGEDENRMLILKGANTLEIIWRA